MTTGYQYLLNDTTDATNGIITVSGESVDGTSTFGTLGTLGAPGYMIITVQCDAPGSAILHAANVRPWEFFGWDTDYEAYGELVVDVTCIEWA